MHKSIVSWMKYIPFLAMTYLPVHSAETDNMAGIWGSTTFSGNFKEISPKLKDFHWLILEQTRTRDDSSKGMRFSEDLLYGQVGYSINPNASVWLGYAHIWNHPLDKAAFQENRAYEDFLWKSSFGELEFKSRSRLDQRVREDTGNVGIRFRQLFQASYPLRFIDDDLRVYVGDEVHFYLKLKNMI